MSPASQRYLRLDYDWPTKSVFRLRETNFPRHRYLWISYSDASAGRMAFAWATTEASSHSVCQHNYPRHWENQRTLRLNTAENLPLVAKWTATLLVNAQSVLSTQFAAH